MNIPDTCDATRNQCGCASQPCCKSSSAESLFASIQKGNVVCNLGTSGGFHIKTASENAGTTGKVIVIAAVPSILSSVKSEISLSGIPNAELRLGDVDSLPIDSNTIDIIAGENSLATVKNRNIVFKEFHRILRPAGKLVLAEVIGFCVASCQTSSNEFDSITTMFSNDLNECLRLNGFSTDSINISVDETNNYSKSADAASTIALKAIIKASKA